MAGDGVRVADGVTLITTSVGIVAVGVRVGVIVKVADGGKIGVFVLVGVTDGGLSVAVRELVGATLGVTVRVTGIFVFVAVRLAVGLPVNGVAVTGTTTPA